MSIPVGLGELAAAIEGYTTTPYLLTAAGGRPHAVSVSPRWRDGALMMGAGRRTSANIAAQPDIALLWPPDAEGGYSLIVDATAMVDGEELVATPVNAVLHRSADHLPAGTTGEPTTRSTTAGSTTAGSTTAGSTATGATSCGNDCVPVPLGGADG